MTGDTPVKDMASALHKRIKEYGGPKAVFDQLDPRFKATEMRNIEGKKRGGGNKITFKGFEKSCERLSKEQKTVEKMNFGIKGNPLLLANVFKILGIKGFEHLTETTFVEPDPKAKLFAIDNKVDGLKEQIYSLDERLETHMRRRSSITALKAATDFDNLTKRLLGIVENKTDTFIYNIASGTYMNYLKTTVEVMKFRDFNQVTDIFQFQKQYNLIEKAKKENTSFNLLSQKIIEQHTGKDRAVLYFCWLIYEYDEYCFLLNSLRRCKRLIAKDIIDFGSSNDSNLYMMGSLHVLLLYLVVALQYIKKVGINSNTSLNDIHDEDIIRRIKEMGITRSEKNNKVTKSRYFETMTQKLIKEISKIIKQFVLHEIYPLPKLLEKINVILNKIVSLYKKALVDTENSLAIETGECGRSMKILGDLFSIGLIGVCGRFRLDNGIMDDFDVLLNEISILVKNIIRDLHG